MDAKPAPKPKSTRLRPAGSTESEGARSGSGLLVALALAASCCLALAGDWLPGTRVAATLAPWVLLAGLPCAGMRLGELALALPACAAAARLDWAQGTELADLLRLGAVGLVLCLLLAHAAKLAAMGSRSGSPAALGSWAHALLWWLFVPAAPLALMLTQLDGGAGSSAARWITGLGPMAWLFAPADSMAMPLAGAALIWVSATGQTARRSAPLLAILALAIPSGAQHSALVPMEVVIDGPLEACTASMAGGGRTHLRLRLSQGERVQLELPFDPGPQLPGNAVPSGTPTFDVEGGGSVRFKAWNPSLDQRWRALPTALRDRGRPPTAGDRVQPHSALMPMLLACALVGWTLRKSWGRSLLFASLAAAGLWGLTPHVDAGGTSIIEGDAEASSWIQVESRRGGLTVRPGQLLRLERRASEPLNWNVAGERVGSLEWSVEGDPSLYLFTQRSDLGALNSERNDSLDLAEIWIRGSGLQTWWAAGPWPRFTSLAELEHSKPELQLEEQRTSTDFSAPPGWLVSGLPLGRGVLLGRVKDGIAGSWLRLTGFE